MEPLAEETKMGSQSDDSSELYNPDIKEDKILYGFEVNCFREERKVLPIYAKREEILKAICDNLFVIITGETGSGKTTQIPQYVVDDLKREDILSPLPEKNSKGYPFKWNDAYDSRLDRQDIRCVVTQPRRVAAIQMAKRVAFESGSRLGGHVGYTIRFEDNSTPDTGIKYVTDGILVREWLMDPNLEHYDVVILDEAHERSLFTDILFSLVKQAVVRRKGTLRLIVTSATLQTQLFSEFFYNWPIIEASGRCYPVDVMYIDSHPEKRILNSVKAAIRIHINEPIGDILAFLTGFDEWDKAWKLCHEELMKLHESGKEMAPMMIMPLYGSMNTKQQNEIFQKTPEGSRKIVFCTNIAETSLTVDGIAYVIDWGLVKQKIHNPETGMETLMVVPISQVQAQQRTGRAGRTMEGRWIRLYKHKHFEKKMPKQTVPEILRTNLWSTVLTLLNLGIKNVIKFDFIETPGKESILFALKQLFLLKAVDKDAQLTDLGKEMNRFPLEPAYAKLILASNFYKCQDDMIILVSILSTENIWIPVAARDETKFSKLEGIRKGFAVENSDHLALVNVYQSWQDTRYSDGFLRKNFLLFRALKQARKIRGQLLEIAEKVYYRNIEHHFESAMNLSDDGPSEKRFRRWMTEAFYMNAARKINAQKEGTYLTANDKIIVKVDRWSVFDMFSNFPEWLLYTELAGTMTGNKGIMRLSTDIKVKWIEKKIPMLEKVDMERLEYAGDPPIHAGEKRTKIVMEKIETLIDQKKMENEAEEKNAVLSRDEKIRLAKERMLERKRQKTK